MSDREAPDEPPGPPPGPGGEEPAPPRSALTRILQLTIHAPTQVALRVLEDLPERAVKERDHLESHIRNARVVGEAVVNKARRDTKRRFTPTENPAPTAPRAPKGTTTASPSPASPEPAGATDRGPLVETAPATGAPVPGPAPAERRHGGPAAPVDLAIPDYEALSASQVVRRLDGLAPPDLEAVYAHEAASRRRRTILHRAQQLLGTEDAPGRPGPSA